MNENYKFILHTTYDKPAYQALSEVSWVLFRKHRMQVAAYPALFSLAALIAIILIFNWGSYDTPLRFGLHRPAISGHSSGSRQRQA